MAEFHGRGGRDGKGGAFRRTNNAGGDPRGYRSREDRPGSGRGGEGFRAGRDRSDEGTPRRDSQFRPRREYGDRPRQDRGQERGGQGDRPRQDRGDDRGGQGYRPRDGFRDDRREGGRGERGYEPRGPRRDFEERPRRDYGDRPRQDRGDDRGGQGYRPRRDFEERPRREFGDRPRRDYSDRPGAGRGGEGFRAGRDRSDEGTPRRNYGDRPRQDRGDDRGGQGYRPRDGFRDDRREGGRGERGYEPRGPRRDFEERPRRDYGDRPRQDRGSEGFRAGRDRSDEGTPRRDYGDRPRQDRGDDRGSQYEDRGRPERPRSPEIDEDVTGSELDRSVRAQLRTLESRNAEWVSKHLVMAARLMDADPELAFEHALAASRRAGRMAPVREAVGLTAYAAGHYGEALREFRTFRRISGSSEHLPLMADCERGLGRPERALELARSEDAQSLDTPGKVELAMVESGALSDMGDPEAALAALEIPQLDKNRAFSFSPRLFRAYADALEAVGRSDEAGTWRRQALLAESALGVGDFAEPDILDLVGDEEPRPERPAAPQDEHTQLQQAPEGGPVSGEPAVEAAVEAVREEASEPAAAGAAVPVSDEDKQAAAGDD